MKRISTFVLFVVCLFVSVRSVKAVFPSQANLFFSFGTLGSEVNTEYVLANDNLTDCAPNFLVDIYPAEAEGLETYQPSFDMLQIVSLEDEKTATFSGELSCFVPTLLVMQVASASANSAYPWVAIQDGQGETTDSSQGQMFLEAEPNEKLYGKLFFPSAGDKLELHGWSNKNASTGVVPPITSLVGSSWWQAEFLSRNPRVNQLWVSQLTHPENENDYQTPPECHRQSDLFFVIFSNPYCRSFFGEPLAFLSPSVRLWQGDYDPMQASPVFPVQAPASKFGDIIISEVMWSGSFSDTFNNDLDQWMELFNTTTQAESLNGLAFLNASDNGQPIYFPAGLSIPARGYFLISREEDASSLLAQKSDWVAPRLHLQDQEAHVVLQGHDSEVLDELPLGVWQAGWRDASQRKAASAQRLDFLKLGNDWGNWGDCSREGFDRCLSAVENVWKNSLTRNFATPWHNSVL